MLWIPFNDQHQHSAPGVLMACRSKEIDASLRALALQAGAQVEFEPKTRGPHRRVYFTYQGRSSFNVLSTTPGNGFVMKQAVLSQARRTLRALGAHVT
jgi:hypothetical protein